MNLPTRADCKKHRTCTIDEDALCPLECGMFEPDIPGPTGRFPEGKAGPDDCGEIAMGIRIDEETGYVEIHFGIPVIWLKMTKAQALGFADALRVVVNSSSN